MPLSLLFQPSHALACFDSCACLCSLFFVALAWIAILLAVVLFSIGASPIPFIEHNDSNQALLYNSLPKEVSADPTTFRCD